MARGIAAWAGGAVLLCALVGGGLPPTARHAQVGRDPELPHSGGQPAAEPGARAGLGVAGGQRRSARGRIPRPGRCRPESAAGQERAGAGAGPSGSRFRDRVGQADHPGRARQCLEEARHRRQQDLGGRADARPPEGRRAFDAESRVQTGTEPRISFPIPPIARAAWWSRWFPPLPAVVGISIPDG